MLLISLLSLCSFGFGMQIVRRSSNDNTDMDASEMVYNILELGPHITPQLVPDELVDAVVKRGVDPLSIPRLIKEPPLKKRSGDYKRGDVVYPSAAKQTVPLVRVREPPLKRGQLFLEDLLQFNDDSNRQQFLDPIRRIRYDSNRRYLSW